MLLAAQAQSHASDEERCQSLPPCKGSDALYHCSNQAWLKQAEKAHVNMSCRLLWDKSWQCHFRTYPTDRPCGTLNVGTAHGVSMQVLPCHWPGPAEWYLSNLWAPASAVLRSRFET